MECRNEILPPRRVLFVERIGPYQPKAGEAWHCLWEWICGRGLQGDVQSSVGFGLDSPRLIPSHLLRYYACAEFPAQIAPDPSNGIGEMQVTGGRFALYRMKGDYAQMPDCFSKLHDEILPHHGFVPDYSRPFLENYIKMPDEDGAENALTDLCLPIRDETVTPAR